LSGRDLCDELITRPEESYRLCCVVVCDLETSRMGAPYIYDISSLRVNYLTLILLTWRKWCAPNNASKHQMGFNSAFEGLMGSVTTYHRIISCYFIFNYLLFAIFVMKWKVYYYNQVLCVVLWYLCVLVYAV